MMQFARGFIDAYTITEEEYQYNKRVESEDRDIERVKQIIETEGTDSMLLTGLEGKIKILREDSDEQNIQYHTTYSQKQVSEMARLLKAAEILSKNLQLNPEGRDFLQEFTAVPNIVATLRQMSQEGKDENSYIARMREQARENRQNGISKTMPETKWEAATRQQIIVEPEIKQALDFPENDLLVGIYHDLRISQGDLEKSYGEIYRTRQEQTQIRTNINQGR